MEPNDSTLPAIGATVDSQSVRHGRFTVIKHDDNGTEIERISFDNDYVNAGAQVWLDSLIGVGGLTPFNNANSFIGVGDSSTAVAASQTDLQASSNKTYQGMDSSYPSRTAQTITWSATFNSSQANYAWNEVSLFNASTGGAMLCRKVQTLGTKASGTWTVLYTITVP